MIFYLTIVFFLVGLVFGGFINVLIYRLPVMVLRSAIAVSPELQTINLSVPQSFCPHCKQTIPLLYRMPLIGYFLSHRQCCHCQAPIHWRYPLLEGICGIYFAGCYLLFGFASSSYRLFGIPIDVYLAMAFGYLLLALAMIDYDCHLLPDDLTFLLMFIGFWGSFFSTTMTPQLSVLGFIVGFGILWIHGKIGQRLFGREVIFGGDLKFVGAMGTFLNPMWVSFAIALAAVVPFLYKCFSKSKTSMIPFGPFLAGSGFIFYIIPRVL